MLPITRVRDDAQLYKILAFAVIPACYEVFVFAIMIMCMLQYQYWDKTVLVTMSTHFSLYKGSILPPRVRGSCH